MFRVLASNGPGGVSVILESPAAAIRKVAEFRDAGFRSISVLNSMGATIEEAALAVMAKGEAENSA
jgi:hypothetical protein